MLTSCQELVKELDSEKVEKTKQRNWSNICLQREDVTLAFTFEEVTSRLIL